MSATTFDLGVPVRRSGRSDYEAARSRTRRTMSVSVIAHMLLLTWLVVVKPAVEPKEDLTVISLVDPGDLASAPPASEGAAPMSPAEVQGMTKASATEERFTRARTDADIAPRPQTSSATEDRIAARLASIQSKEPTSVSSIAAAGVPSGLLSSPAGVSGSMGTGTGPLTLARGGAGSGAGPALSLTRGGNGTGVAPAVVSTGLPAEGSAASAPARSSESSARRSMAGAMLMGPVADRPVIHYTTPIYPEWAKRDAVEGSTTLYFIVRPDGSIQENILVQKTAGFEDFDENARTALREWRFAPLTGGRTGEQWGTITFHFRLREGK
jgi:protein TonB